MRSQTGRHFSGTLQNWLISLPPSIRADAGLEILTLDVVKSSAIEGESLEMAQVRSSLAQRLGIDIGALIPPNRTVEGVVEMMLDATQHYAEPLSAERLFGWHAALFLTGFGASRRITVGAWRKSGGRSTSYTLVEKTANQ